MYTKFDKVSCEVVEIRIRQIHKDLRFEGTGKAGGGSGMSDLPGRRDKPSQLRSLQGACVRA